MKILTTALSLILLLGLSTSSTCGQNTRQLIPKEKRAKLLSPQDREKAFVSAKPAVGDAVPDLKIFDANGKSVRMSEFRGKYVVLTFGCLT